MNMQKTCITNGVSTGLIGMALSEIFVMLVSSITNANPLAYLLPVLFIPASIGVTHLFMRLNFKNMLTGLIAGGAFSTINSLFVFSLIEFAMTGSIADMAVFARFIIPLAFIVGAVSGAILVKRK